jgi:peptide methionine sulfoxide reductase MsrB
MLYLVQARNLILEQDGPFFGTEIDNDLFMRSTELMCSTCVDHLGHVFNDGLNLPAYDTVSTQYRLSM